MNSLLCYHSFKNGSAVPMDQELEQSYNKPVKAAGGIIGITCRKEAVCKWNIIKHEKAHYTKFIKDVSMLRNDDEYSLHHEFSVSATKHELEVVEQVMSYVSERSNPFDLSSTTLTNIVTGKQIDRDTTSFFIDFLKDGEDQYQQFRTLRLQKTTVKLFDPISKTRKSKK